MTNLSGKDAEYKIIYQANKKQKNIYLCLKYEKLVIFARWEFNKPIKIQAVLWPYSQYPHRDNVPTARTVIGICPYSYPRYKDMSS